MLALSPHPLPSSIPFTICRRPCLHHHLSVCPVTRPLILTPHPHTHSSICPLTLHTHPLPSFPSTPLSHLCHPLPSFCPLLSPSFLSSFPQSPGFTFSPHSFPFLAPLSRTLHSLPSLSPFLSMVPERSPLTPDLLSPHCDTLPLLPSLTHTVFPSPHTPFLILPLSTHFPYSTLPLPSLPLLLQPLTPSPRFPFPRLAFVSPSFSPHFSPDYPFLPFSSASV